MKRNIPELAASLGVRTPIQTPSSFPLVDERPIEERPPWEPRTRFEVESDISQIRSRDKSLGESLAWIVDSLLQDESEAKNAEKIKLQKREALESLSYVRDVLMTNTMELEHDRLIGREERSRRRQKARKEKEDRQAASAAAMLNPPAPAPVNDSHFRHFGTQRVKRSPAHSPSRSPPPHGSSPSGDLSQRAPWNFTRSSFGGSTGAVPSSLLPRPPPPTSTTLRRDTKAPDQTPPKNDQYLDPLGALR